MGRRVNDGDRTGIKQDKFRNSRFEYDRSQENPRANEVSSASNNTLGGPYDENRGRRNAEDMRGRWDNSPFENGRVYNWNHRQGWDQFYYRDNNHGSRNHGGALLDHDISQRGKGPRGYQRADESIYEDVCIALERSRDVDASEIEISVKDGCVYLNGTIDNRQSKRMAEIEIENISGVRDVQNMLTLRSPLEDMH